MVLRFEVLRYEVNRVVYCMGGGVRLPETKLRLRYNSLRADKRIDPRIYDFLKYFAKYGQSGYGQLQQDVVSRFDCHMLEF